MSNLVNSQKFIILCTQALSAILFTLAAGCQQHAPGTKLAAYNAPHDQLTVHVSDERLNETARLEAIRYTMLAEVAWDRKLSTQSINYFLHALHLYPDSKLAARATEVSLIANNFSAALEASHKWANLAPNNPNAQAIATTLALKANLNEVAYQRLTNLMALKGETFHKGIQLIQSQMRDKNERLNFHGLLKILYSDHPDNKYATFALAHSALDVGDTEMAEALNSKVLKQTPYWQPAVELQLELLTTLGKNEAAILFLHELLEKRPDMHDMRLQFGQLLIELNHIDEAKQTFQQLTHEPGQATEAFVNLAIIALAQNQQQHAESYLSKVLALDPNHHAASYYLGELAEKKSDNFGAIGWYSNVGLGPYYLTAQMKLVRLIAANGDLNGALTRIHTLMLAYPQYHKELTIVSVQVLVDNQMSTNAMTILNEALSDTPEDIDLLYARSLVAAHLEDYKRTEQDLKRVIQLAPDHTDALNALGFTLADRTDRHQEALGYIERALQISPNNPAIIDSMGWVLYRLGQHSDAIRHLQKAWDLSGDGEIAAHLGEVLWMHGRKEDAIKTWKSALEGAPNHEVLLEVYQRFVTDP